MVGFSSISQHSLAGAMRWRLLHPTRLVHMCCVTPFIGKSIMATIDQDFFDRANQVIDLVNQQAKIADPFLASGSLLYAAARYTAYEVALKAQNEHQLRDDKEEAIHFFTEQFAEMLEQCLDEHISGEDKLI
jgi:hypothetical protein